ncbi:MAG: proline dehydrogenase family protein [Candidatus Nitrosocaldus sp.]|nr:proline dehydrogenase family protein [Candidatus Nitrosocaldus sp.]MDW8000162.1 proline dehydrogenase family protein [Candidatus Nitrosocaldus sp.]
MSIYEHLVLRMARRWVAGSSIHEALEYAKQANSMGMKAIINCLGEHSTSKDEAYGSTQEYMRLLDAMHEDGVDGSISVKLTQIGLDVDYDTCMGNILGIVRHASRYGTFVWIDMESSPYYQQTVSIYLSTLNQYGHTGVAYQAYIKEHSLDLMHMLERGGIIRLVKGAYREDASVVYRSRRHINTNFRRLMRMLFKHSTRMFAIATHDGALVDEAIELSREHPAREFEFQMLKGIRDDLKRELVRRGFRVAEYIPYGMNISGYVYRRIRERPANLLLLARSLL